MRFSYAFRALFLTITLASTTWMLADDDEGEEHESHEREHGGASRGQGDGEKRGSSPAAAPAAPSQSVRNLAPVSNELWKTECSSCHMLYHPGLLPSRSWKAMMGSLDKHFGENASLEPAARDQLLAFLVANSADVAPSRRSAKINQSIPASSTPLRITQTPYWLRKHDELSAAVFKRPQIKSQANCVACHKEAEKGLFSEETVQIPR